MTTDEHISDFTMQRYHERALDAGETLAVQRHVASCEMCREKLARMLNAEKAFRAVKNDFAFGDLPDEPEHLPYEQLALFADGGLDEVDREIAESHFAICSECSKDLADLQSFQKIAASSASEIPVEPKRKSLWQRLFIFDSISSFAPVAAVLLIAVLFGAWFLLRFAQTTPQIAETNTNLLAPAPTANSASPLNINTANLNFAPNANTSDNQNAAAPIKESETLYAVNDGAISIDQNGNVEGLENLSAATQKAIRQTVKNGKVSAANTGALGGNAGVLMGDGNADGGIPFALETPIGKVIEESQPVLRWKPLKDATAYTVTLTDDKFRVVAESEKLTTTSWKPSKPLPRGANYSWQVTAILPDGTETISPSSPAPQARFRIVEQSAFDEINRLKKSPTRSHLALGVLYANAGLKAEARREFQTLLKKNPNSALARKLLQSVR